MLKLEWEQYAFAEAAFLVCSAHAPDTMGRSEYAAGGYMCPLSGTGGPFASYGGSARSAA